MAAAPKSARDDLEKTMTLASFARSVALAGALLVPTFAYADTAQSEAQAAADKWDQAFNSGDMKALAGLYTADALLVTNAKTESGEAIETFFSGMKAKGFEGHKIVVQSVTQKGDLVIATGRWEITGPSDGGAKKKFEGNWVNVLERKDGQLKTALHSWN